MVNIGIEEIDLINNIGQIFIDNLVDVSTTQRERWVYYKLPETDKNLPQVTIEMENPEYSYASAGDVLYDELGTDGIYREYSFVFANIPLNLYITTSKVKGKQEVNLEGTKFFMESTVLNKAVTSKVKDVIIKKRDLFLGYIEDIMIKDIEETFDDGTRFWTSKIACDILFKDTWVKEYLDGQLVKEYNLSILVTENN